MSISRPSGWFSFSLWDKSGYFIRSKFSFGCLHCSQICQELSQGFIFNYSLAFFLFLSTQKYFENNFQYLNNWFFPNAEYIYFEISDYREICGPGLCYIRILCLSVQTDIPIPCETSHYATEALGMSVPYWFRVLSTFSLISFFSFSPEPNKRVNRPRWNQIDTPCAFYWLVRSDLEFFRNAGIRVFNYMVDVTW